MPRRTEEPFTRAGRPGPVPAQTPGEAAMREPAGAPARRGTEPEAVRRPARRHAVSAAVNIGAVERAVSVAGGALLALSGLSRRSWARTPLVGVGAILVYRGARGHSYLYERIGIDRANAPIEIEQAVTINRKPEEVYAFWRQLENLPRFMRHLRSVKQESPTRSHWTAQTALTGRTLEWDSEITEDKPNELIRWRSVPDGSIQHSGEVRFRAAPGARGTEVHVRMEYRPIVGVAVGAAMYPFTRQTLKEEMRRLKHVMEAGEIPTTEGQPAGRGR
ncbi:SRPBCC family protein [Sulfurifustis variabilis]|uniref:SRPBCC family protein n=1 Tax=Sulfurifustis variabilis TaxID=1675686 RepID=UPI0011E4CA74|nr:SRPBCC family protein [Sulfurifustis variabilis]